MMRIRLAGAVALIAAAGIATLAAGRSAEEEGAAKLAQLTAGRTAGPSRRCVTPDQTTAPEIINRRAIAYRDGGTLYVGPLHGGCPILEEGRLTVVNPLNGELCEGDAVHVVDTGRLLGTCAFDRFTPYVKAK